MSKQTDWNIGLTEDLQNPVFAREFVQASIDEGIPINLVLGKIVRAIGVRNYSRQTGLAAANIIRAVQQDSNPTQRTIERLLKPLGLTLGVAISPDPPQPPQ